MDLHEEIFQKISSGTFSDCPESALEAISVLQPSESVESIEAKMRRYLSCSDFCMYISRAIASLGVEYTDLILSCCPETLYLVENSSLREDLCVQILSRIAANPLESVDIRFAQIRVLLSNTAITIKIRNSLREAIISVKDNFFWITKLILLFHQEKLIDLIFEIQQPILFWTFFMEEFVSTKSMVSKKVLLHLLNRIIDMAGLPQLCQQWELPGNTIENQKFVELCFSLNQNSATLLQERLRDLNFYVKLVNNGKLCFQWLFIPFRLLIEHHNVNVLRSMIILFNTVNWDFIRVDHGADIIASFITDPLLLMLSKQLVYTKPSLGPSILQTLLKLVRRYPSLLEPLWIAVMNLGGNWTLKYHLLLLIARSGSENLFKLPLTESTSQLRQFMSTVPCVPEPLKGSIITAGIKCGLSCFDWSNGTLEHFIQFLSVFQIFQYHLVDFDELKNDFATVFERIGRNLNTFQNARHDHSSISVASFYYHVWYYQLYLQLRSSFELEYLDLLILPKCRSLYSFRALSDSDSEDGNEIADCQIIRQYFTEFFSHCSNIRDFSSLEEVIRRFFCEVAHRNNHHLIIQIIRECIDQCKLLSLILLCYLCSEEMEKFSQNTANVIDVNFIQQLLDDASSNGERLQVSFSDQVLEHFKWKTLTALNGYLQRHKLKDNCFFDSVALDWGNYLIYAQKWLQSAPMFLVDSILKFVSCCPSVINNSGLFEEMAHLAADSVVGSRKLSGSQEYFGAFGSYIQFVFHVDALGNPALEGIIERHAKLILETSKDECVLMFISHLVQKVGIIAASLNSKLFTLGHSGWISEASVMYPCSLERDEMFHIVETSIPFLGCAKILNDKVLSHFPDYKFSFESFFSILFDSIETEDRSECCLAIFKSLMNVDQKILASVDNKRQHVGSSAFKRRFRLWSHVCGILLQLPETDGSAQKKISSSILTCLHQDTTDPSLRLLIEMALASVMDLSSWVELIPLNLADLASSFVTSIIHSVGLVFLIHINRSNVTSMFEKLDCCLLFLFKWATVAHNNIRISAQIFLVKLWNHLNNMSEFYAIKADKFSHFEAMVEFWSSHAKFKVNMAKSVAAIYYYYDFSSTVSSNGYYKELRKRIIERFAIEDDIGTGRNFDKFNSGDEPLGWELNQREPIGSEDIDQVGDTTDDHGMSTSQLKPVTSVNLDQLFENEYKLIEVAHASVDEKKRPGNLILVASLLEKMVNLGGLCRTGEVQGIEKLVVNNWKACEMSADFVGLSVTASKWLPIEEVKIECLTQYFNALKIKGYTVVALEQSNKSQALQSFTFPKKCAVVLGNEKRGVPGNLLEFCDIHIEIPQVGVIRSLNVHVASSLLVWEYSKQHIHAANNS